MTLLPEGKTVEVPAQTTVMEAVAQAGVTITAPCGREGSCGKCRVEVTSGVAPPSGVEREALTPAQLASGVRLSCQARAVGDASVTVPAASRAADMRVLLGGVSRAVPFEPNVVKT
ncbi:2Fe-2S iron-sulfur cluster binding domain-containing protein, partial [bacterium]|nr:2Fe-2S iron-sulfur cluster binding domain-containing protein [bacterium]